MSLLLLLRSQQPQDNRGHAQMPALEALGVGHVVVEEISGHAELQAVRALGAGVVMYPTPKPDDKFFVGGQYRTPSRLERITGSGAAALPVLRARGIGEQVYEDVFGAGASLLPALQAGGNGALAFPVLRGAGSATLVLRDALGFGLLRLPPAPKVVPAPARPVYAASWDEDGYALPVPAPTSRARRQQTRAAAVVEEDEDLLALMEL